MFVVCELLDEAKDSRYVWARAREYTYGEMVLSSLG